MWFERSLNVSNGNRGAENAVKNRNENFNEVRFKINEYPPNKTVNQIIEWLLKIFLKTVGCATVEYYQIEVFKYLLNLNIEALS